MTYNATVGGYRPDQVPDDYHAWCIKKLSEYPLAELRRRQDFVDKHITKVMSWHEKSPGKPRVLACLMIKREHLTRAVMLREFGEY